MPLFTGLMWARQRQKERKRGRSVRLAESYTYVRQTRSQAALTCDPESGKPGWWPAGTALAGGGRSAFSDFNFLPRTCLIFQGSS